MMMVFELHWASSRARVALSVACALFVCVLNSACDVDGTVDRRDDAEATPAEQEPFDTRIQLFDVASLAESATASVSQFARGFADLHQQMDAAEDMPTRVKILAEGTRLASATADADARAIRLLRVEWAARFAELELSEQGAAFSEAELSAICDDLASLLQPGLELPRDTVSARALVALGDVASHAKRPKLAAASFMRSIDVMDELRRDIERDLGLAPRVGDAVGGSR